MNEIAASRTNQLQLFRHADNTRVLVLDFPKLAAQARMLNRVAALIEKEYAPRDRVLGEQELLTLIGTRNENYDTFYLGHDYEAEALARFFNLAAAGEVRLNPDEELLLRLLLREGVLAADPSGVMPVDPKHALVSVTQPQHDDPATPADEGIDDALRAAILRHELSHGEFFTSKAYREYVRSFWENVMGEPDRQAFRDFLSGIGYDAGNDMLMMNEMQAYLANTPDKRLFDARMLELPAARVQALQRRFVEGRPPGPLFAAPAKPARAVVKPKP